MGDDGLRIVERQYARADVLDSILSALRRAGKDTTKLVPSDLAPVDAFHVRGRRATVELAQRASLGPGLRVLDVGCGLGGSVRYLATEHGCRATGVDLTKEYVEVARALADLVGLGPDAVEFRQGSALSLPFEDASFDVAWTEHVQMNVADKPRFYREIARVLVPGGRLAFHDVFEGGGGPPHFPVPWADDEAISFLAASTAVRALLADLGFTILDWEDKSRESLEWFVDAAEKLNRSGPPPLGLHLVMGETAKAKAANVIRNLREERIVVVEAVATRDPSADPHPRSATPP